VSSFLSLEGLLKKKNLGSELFIVGLQLAVHLRFSEMNWFPFNFYKFISEAFSKEVILISSLLAFPDLPEAIEVKLTDKRIELDSLELLLKKFSEFRYRVDDEIITILRPVDYSLITRLLLNLLK
jgi:hypothetical protein